MEKLKERSLCRGPQIDDNVPKCFPLPAPTSLPIPMRACLQRVSRAHVSVEGEICGQIDRGLLVLLGVVQGDQEADARQLAQKIVSLRVFDDPQGKMNLSVGEVGGAVLVVSQFTLAGDCRKGRRPSFDAAARPELAEQLYESFRPGRGRARHPRGHRPVPCPHDGRVGQRRPGDVRGGEQVKSQICNLLLPGLPSPAKLAPAIPSIPCPSGDTKYERHSLHGGTGVDAPTRYLRASPTAMRLRVAARRITPSTLFSLPDVNQIEMLKLIRKPPYRAEVFDVLEIRANTRTDQPLDNQYFMVEAEGTVNLGRLRVPFAWPA